MSNKNIFKKLKNLFHKHKFKTLPARDYSVRGIAEDERGSFRYTENGKEIKKICKCGYFTLQKIDITTKKEGE